MEITNKVIFYENHVYAVLDEYDNTCLIGNMYECTKFVSLSKKVNSTLCRNLRVVELKSPTTLTIK